MDRSHDRHIIQSLLIRHSAPSSSTGSATVPGDRSVCQVIPNLRLCHTHAPPFSHLHETAGCVNDNSDDKKLYITAVTIVEAMGNNNDDVSSLVCYAESARTVISGRITSVELETLPAGPKPRTSHHRSPGGERRGKRKR